MRRAMHTGGDLHTQMGGRKAGWRIKRANLRQCIHSNSLQTDQMALNEGTFFEQNGFVREQMAVNRGASGKKYAPVHLHIAPYIGV